MKRILMIAHETERWGPARLPQPLAQAGVEVAVFCSQQNPLNHSNFAARHYELEGLKSSRRFAQALGRVMADWKPDLVIPCDEPIVAMLHFLLKNQRVARCSLNAESLAVLQRSIGHVDKLDTMILKLDTRLLAESLGIPVPPSQVVHSADEADAAATDLGFPVYLKESFSWAGQGTVKCKTEAEIRQAFQGLQTKTPWFKKVARRVLGRSWYPVDTALEVQKAVEGEPVMYSVAALDGKVVAGFFGRRMMRSNVLGPSTIIEISDNAKCRWAAEKMIAAMGASGFLAFDFMHCEQTGDMYLLECNPRPNQMCHLGYHIGVDMCAALAAALCNDVQSTQVATGEKIVPLFPQEWLRDETAALSLVQELDIPVQDSSLFQFMLGRGRTKGNSIVSLVSKLQSEGVAIPNYTLA